MSQNEIAAWATALYWRKQYEECTPEVGMGPFLSSLLDSILGHVDATPEERTEIMQLTQAMES